MVHKMVAACSSPGREHPPGLRKSIPLPRGGASPRSEEEHPLALGGEHPQGKAPRAGGGSPVDLPCHMDGFKPAGRRWPWGGEGCLSMQTGGCDDHEGQMAPRFDLQKGDTQPRSPWVSAGLQTPMSPGKGQPNPPAGVSANAAASPAPRSPASLVWAPHIPAAPPARKQLLPAIACMVQNA